jgi:4-amino-4-deoxy-L-arabinose transferase-like glycosyltransferase
MSPRKIPAPTASKLVTRLAILLSIALWIFFVLRIPTFDFDESLYRRVAESMRERQDPWFMAWDDRLLHHKPPVFYWLIWAAAAVIDFGKNQIGSIAARVPSLLSSLGILMGLFFGTRFILGRSGKGADENTSSNAVLAFLSASFPVLTATAVIFDPLQSLALLPAILIPARMFYQDAEPSRATWLAFGAGLALATGIKGLNGLVVPVFALGVQMLLHFRLWGWPRFFRISMRTFLFGILPALAACAAWFYLLHQKAGPAFTEEFFWVQHLGRSRTSMEDHAGGWYYHVLVLFFGSTFLTPLLIHQWMEHRPDWLRISYPLVFALSFVFFFSLSATKLPHYLWPAWPALALFSALLAESSDKTLAPDKGRSSGRLVSRLPSLLASLPVILIGGLLFALALAPDALLLSLPKSPVSISILSHWEPFSIAQKAALLVGALTCLFFQIRRSLWARSPAITAICSTLVVFSLCLGLLPSLERIAIRPFQEIAADLKKIPAHRLDCIRYSGSFSPTLSLALAPDLIHNRCEPGEMRFLVSPEWKADECERLGFKVYSTRAHLVLCGKP